MDFKESTLQMLLNEDEFEELKNSTAFVASRFEDIEGVFITGSLVQKIQLPEPPVNLNLSKLSQAYAEIVGRTRRKLFPHRDSDFDFWILTKEQPGNESLPEYLDSKAIELISWYAEQDKVDLAEWIYRKHQAFGDIYKKQFLYSSQWNASNCPIPSNAEGFRSALEKEIREKIPSLVAKVSYYFSKSIPGEFIEVRAFPASVFNLKPERIPVGDYEDRTPFPFFIRDWVDKDRNCILLYTRSDARNLIYPFNPEGYIPGENIAKFIGWTPRHIDHLLYYTKKGGSSTCR